MVEQRAAFEIDAALRASFKQEISAAYARDRADKTARRVARFETRAADRDIRGTARTVQRAKQGVIHAADAAVTKLSSAARKLAESFTKPFEGIISAAADLMASPSKPTELEAEIVPRVSSEQQQHAAEVAAAAENAAAKDDLISGLDRRQQEKSVRLAQTLGIPPTAEASLGRDEHDRERDRGREL